MLPRHYQSHHFGNFRHQPRRSVLTYLVGAVGFEPTYSSFQTKTDNQAPVTHRLPKPVLKKTTLHQNYVRFFKSEIMNSLSKHSVANLHDTFNLAPTVRIELT